MFRVRRLWRRAPVALAAIGALALVSPAGSASAKAPKHPGDRTVRVQLLGINDLHGHLQPNTPGTLTLPPSSPGGAPTRVPAGGAAYLATHLRQLEGRNPNTLLFGGGDLVGASPLVSALFHDEPTIRALNLMGFDDSTVGNHEFDHGYRELLRLQDGGCHRDDTCDPDDEFPGADFQYLAANVVRSRDNRPILPPYEIAKVGGVKIGVIGVVLKDTPTIVTPSGVEGLRFTDEADAVNRYVPELERKGVQTIVALVHQGGFQTGYLNECKGLNGPIVDITKRLDPAVSVVFSGHTHQAYNCRVDGKVLIQGALYGKVISDVNLVFDKATRDLVGVSSKNVPVTQDVAPDPQVKALVDDYTERAAPLANRVVGSVSADLTRQQTSAGESSFGDAIADAQLEATAPASVGGAQIAFMNPGGIRSDLLTASIPGGEQAGQVTYGEIFTAQPFGNGLSTLTLTGTQIRQLLEQQFDSPSPGMNTILQVSRGFSYSWSSARPAGERVDPASIRLNGTTIDPGTTYRVTVNSFLAAGGDRFTILTSGTNPTGGPQDVDALSAYLTAHDPLIPPTRDRITRTG